MPIMAPAMTPIPPSLATADASPERDMPTPIPPWMMGILAVNSPIFKAGKDMNEPPQGRLWGVKAVFCLVQQVFNADQNTA